MRPLSMLATLAMLSLGGCALTVDRVDLAYAPAAAAPVVEGAAAAAPVKVGVSDARGAQSDRISSKKNGYGMEMAAIVANQSAPTVLGAAIETELRARGFALAATVAEGPAAIAIELNRFYADFKVGFFSGDCVGEVAFHAQVRDGDSRILYSRVVTGEGWAKDIQLASGENAKEAVEKAMSDAVVKLVNDAAFQQALLARRRASPTS